MMHLWSPPAVTFDPDTQGTFTVGDGSIEARLARIDNHVWYRIEIVFGSTSRLDGGLFITTPEGTARGIDNTPIGTCVAYDASMNAVYASTVVSTNGGTNLVCTTANGSLLADSQPFDFAAGDTIVMTGDYETA